MTTLAELLTTRTEAEAFGYISGDLAHRNINPRGWSRNSAQYALIDLFARGDSAFTLQRSAVARACARNLVMQIQDTATRDAWLDVIATGFYDLTRFPARAAKHAFRWTASAAASPIDLVPRARVVKTASGMEFRNTGRLASDTAADPATIRLNPGATLVLEMEALVPGIEGNIGVNQTLTLVQAIAGVTVTNPPYSDGTSILSIGLAAETSESLNARCSQRWDRTAVAQLPGALGEWVHEAFTTLNQTSPVVKWAIDDANPNGPGSVDVYVAEVSTTADATVTQIDGYIQPRRSLGAGAYRTRKAQDLVITPTIVLYTLGGSTTNIADVASGLALMELVEPLGGSFFASDIIKVARTISDVYDASTTFVGVTLAPYQRLRISPTILEA